MVVELTVINPVVVEFVVINDVDVDLLVVNDVAFNEVILSPVVVVVTAVDEVAFDVETEEVAVDPPGVRYQFAFGS